MFHNDGYTIRDRIISTQFESHAHRRSGTDACQLCAIVLVINLLLVVADNDDCIEVRAESILVCYPVTAPATSPRTM
jgi:hypothetical protein